MGLSETPSFPSTCYYHQQQQLGALPRLLQIEKNRAVKAAMYVQEVVIDGFKSYARRTVVEG